MKIGSTSIVLLLSSIASMGHCLDDVSDASDVSQTSPPTPIVQTLPPQILQKCCVTTYTNSDVAVELFGQWLFLQPNGSNIYYAAEAFPFDTSIAVPPVSPNWTIFEIDPSYSSGFEVGSRFLFPKSDLSLELNWERLHTQDSESMTVSPQSFGTGNMVGPLFDIGPNSAAYSKAKGKGVFHFDAVNLIVGKMVCFVNDLKARFYTGAGFSRIKQTVSSTFSNAAGTISRTVYSPSTFTGGGPQFGVDFEYNLGCDFYFTGASSLALYMGQLNNYTTYTSFTPSLTGLGIPQPNVQKTTVPNRTQVIPGFEEKLGFSYVACFDRCQATFEIGYQFQIYLNAVQSIDMTAPQVLPSLAPGAAVDMGVYAVGFERTLSNFMLTGPYASASVRF